MCHTLSISFNSNISHALHCSQTWGKGHQWQKILIIDYSQPQKKTKSISYKTLSLFLSNKVWSAPRPAQNLEETNHNSKKDLKRIFHKLQQSSMPSSIRIKKNNWKRNHMWHFHYFMQFWYKSYFYLPKNWGKTAQAAKNT